MGRQQGAPPVRLPRHRDRWDQSARFAQPAPCRGRPVLSGAWFSFLHDASSRGIRASTASWNLSSKQRDAPCSFKGLRAPNNLGLPSSQRRLPEVTGE